VNGRTASPPHAAGERAGDRRRQGHIDWARLVLAGYSLGGHRVLGLAGAWPGWRLDGVRAVLALAPYVRPFLARRTLGGLVAPVMCQGGTLDVGINPWLGKPMGAYESSPPPRYYVEMQRAGHLAWTDLRRVDHATIARYGVAFLNRYVLKSSGYEVLTRRRGAVGTLRWAVES
jgi:hypothetical protein